MNSFESLKIGELNISPSNLSIAIKDPNRFKSMILPSHVAQIIPKSFSILNKNGVL